MSTEAAAASASCDSLESDAGYAEDLTKRSPKGHTEVGHPDIFLVPLEKGPHFNQGRYCSYSFGEKCWEYKAHKVIMLVGATGAGKSTIINTMTNYILGVKWEDNFRFKLVDEHRPGAQSQAHSQTQITSSYTLHRNERHKIPFTLTIIDTPGFGDTRGIERDKAIVEQIREFFTHPENDVVDHIDAVGFVVQASQARLTPTQRYIFESILSLFGKDVKPNIILLATFCDAGTKPAVLDAIKAAEIPFSECVFKFNNVALFGKTRCNKAESDSDEEEEVSTFKLYWQNGMKETKRLFHTVSELEGKSLTLTKEVLEKRKRLEQTVEMLQSQSDIYGAKMKELHKEQEELKRCQRQIEVNDSFQYEIEVVVNEKIPTDVGVLNCDRCQFTCHYPCRRPDNQKRNCHMMDRSGRCMVCPNGCIWSAHVIQKHKYEYTTKKQKKTFTDVERRFRDATGKILTVEEVIGKLKVEVEILEQADASLVAEIHGLLQRLEEIALKPNPIGLCEYIDLLIEDQKKEAKPGWKDRVNLLQSYKGQYSLLDSVKSRFRQGKQKVQKAWNWIVGKLLFSNTDQDGNPL